PVFRHGRPEDLAKLATQAVPFDYPVGSFLMRQGEPADHVLVLTAGEAAIVSPVRGGGELVHTIIRAGQLIGELALLNDGRRPARPCSRTAGGRRGRGRPRPPPPGPSAGPRSGGSWRPTRPPPRPCCA